MTKLVCSALEYAAEVIYRRHFLDKENINKTRDNEQLFLSQGLGTYHLCVCLFVIILVLFES